MESAPYHSDIPRNCYVSVVKTDLLEMTSWRDTLEPHCRAAHGLNDQTKKNITNIYSPLRGDSNSGPIPRSLKLLHGKQDKGLRQMILLNNVNLQTPPTEAAGVTLLSIVQALAGTNGVGGEWKIDQAGIHACPWFYQEVLYQNRPQGVILGAWTENSMGVRTRVSERILERERTNLGRWIGLYNIKAAGAPTGRPITEAYYNQLTRTYDGPRLERFGILLFGRPLYEEMRAKHEEIQAAVQ